MCGHPGVKGREGHFHTVPVGCAPGFKGPDAPVAPANAKDYCPCTQFRYSGRCTAGTIAGCCGPDGEFPKTKEYTVQRISILVDEMGRLLRNTTQHYNNMKDDLQLLVAELITLEK